VALCSLAHPDDAIAFFIIYCCCAAERDLARGEYLLDLDADDVSSRNYSINSCNANQFHQTNFFLPDLLASTFFHLIFVLLLGRL